MEEEVRALELDDIKVDDSIAESRFEEADEDSMTLWEVVWELVWEVEIDDWFNDLETELELLLFSKVEEETWLVILDDTCIELEDFIVELDLDAIELDLDKTDEDDGNAEKVLETQSVFAIQACCWSISWSSPVRPYMAKLENPSSFVLAYTNFIG